MILIPQQRIQSRARREISIHVRIVGEIAVRDAVRRYLRFRVKHGLVEMLVDISPPGLGVTDEIHLWILLEDLVETIEAGVIGPMLKVKKDGHLECLRQLRDLLNMNGIASDGKLLLAD